MELSICFIMGTSICCAVRDRMGDYLIVALSTDEFNWREKQKKCYFSYEKRKQLLEAIRYVDLVIPEESWAQKRKDVKEYHVDTFCYGGMTGLEKFDFFKGRRMRSCLFTTDT